MESSNVKDGLPAGRAHPTSSAIATSSEQFHYLAADVRIPLGDYLRAIHHGEDPQALLFERLEARCFGDWIPYYERARLDEEAELEQP